METTRKKRLLYSEDDRATLRRAILKRRTIIENKKSDSASVAKKNKCWEEVKEEFNSRPNTTKRTSVQLKKLWENIRFRRKKSLEAATRERMKIASKPHIQEIKEEHDFSQVGEENEMDSIDSSVFLTGNTYELVEDTGTPFVEEAVTCDLHCSNRIEHSQESQCSSTWRPPEDDPKSQQGHEKREESEIEDQLLRKRRNLQIHHDLELHQLKIKEQQLKVKLVENQILHEMKLFELQKTKILASFGTF